MNPIGKRILGLVMLVAGIAMGLWIKSVYTTCGSIEDRAIIIAPILIIYGAMLTIAPGLIMIRGEWAQASGGKRLINILAGLIGAGIGLWIRFVVFKDWK